MLSIDEAIEDFEMFCKGKILCVTGEALEMIRTAIKEREQYRAIGTVEEFKALKEKEERFDRNITMFNSIGLEIRNKAIDDFVKFANTMPTVEEEDGEYRPMRLEEMAEQLRAGGENEQSI